MDYLNKILNPKFLVLNLLGFFIMLTYSIVKPVIDSLFLEYQSADMLPAAWILMMIAAFITMEILNQFNYRISLLKLFRWCCVISAVLLLFFMGLFKFYPITSVYFLVVWKEVYIVVLVEMFWSFANVIFSIQSARWSYGWLLAMGSLGSVIGNLAIGSISQIMGSFNSPYFFYVF
jgi:ATP/ADP translocase